MFCLFLCPLFTFSGDGTFTDVTKETGIGPSSLANGAVWVDIDQDGDLDLYVTTVGDTRHYLYINYGGHFREEAMKRNCSLQTSDRRKLSGMTSNVGDFDHDGFLDIYVTEWLPQTLGKVIVVFEPIKTRYFYSYFLPSNHANPRIKTPRFSSHSLKVFSKANFKLVVKKNLSQN